MAIERRLGDAMESNGFSERASFERLDDRMQAGYDLERHGDVAGCARIWLEVWRDVLALCERGGIRTIDELDERFNGTQSLYNWVHDLDTCLWNAGRGDPSFNEARRAFAEEYIARFGDSDALITENMRRAVAESHFELGKPETADKLYREWLAADPQWGFGWVGWSDFYWLMGRKDQKDAGKAEAIFREGLSVEAVRDRDILLERFAEFCTEAGRAEEAAAARRELDALKAALKAKAAAKSRRTSTLVPPVAPAVARRGDVYPSAPAKEPPDVLRADPKPGRNDPCPCGSGKKYKKCCGRE